MTGGLEQAFGGRRRAVETERFLARLAEHIESPSDESWNALANQAMACDAVEGEGDPTRFAYRLGERVGLMLSGDRPTWARLLQGLLAADPTILDAGPGLRLHVASPFSGKLLLTLGGPTTAETYAGIARRAVIAAVHAAGHQADPRSGFLVAVEAVALPGAEVVPTYVPPRSTGEGHAG